MRQTTFSDIEYANRRRKTRREDFLEKMDSVIPWDRWLELIRPYYPSGKRGRPPRDLEKMLRMYLMRSWYNLSDKGMEDAIYDSYSMRKFMRLDFLDEQVPDATTLGKFRHLMEDNHIDEIIFGELSQELKKAGFVMLKGKIVDPRVFTLPG